MKFTYKSTLFLFSLAINYISIKLFDSMSINKYGWWITLLWCISLVTFIIAFIDDAFPIKFNKKQVFTLLAILTVAIGLRLPYLTSIPFFVNGDEANIGLEARKILSGETPHLFTFGWYNFPQFTFFLAAIPMRLFGNNLWGLRLASLFMGLLSIIFTYLFTKLISNTKIAFIAFLSLSFYHFHIHFSRSGTHYMQGTTFIIMSFYFFLQAIKTKQYIFFALAGICSGLGLQVYLSARITLPLLFCYLILLLISKKTRRLLPDLKHICVFIIGFVMAFSPLINLWQKHPDAFMSRTNSVSIFKEEIRMKTEHNTNSWPVVIEKQSSNIAKFFYNLGDRSSQYGFNGPVVDRTTLAFLLIGIFTIIYKNINLFFTSKKNALIDYIFTYSSLLFILVWLFAILVIGGIFTIDAPFSPRLLPITTPIAIITAFSIYFIINKFPLSITIKHLCIMFVLVLILFLNVKMYFHDFHSQEADVNSYRYTFLAYNLAPYTKTNTFILISDRNFNLNHGTVSFLEPKITGEDMYDFPKGFDGFIYNDKRILVFTPDRQPDVLWVKNNYPWVKEKNIYGRKGERLFTLISSTNL